MSNYIKLLALYTIAGNMQAPPKQQLCDISQLSSQARYLKSSGSELTDEDLSCQLWAIIDNRWHCRKQYLEALRQGVASKYPITFNVVAIYPYPTEQVLDSFKECNEKQAIELKHKIRESNIKALNGEGYPLGIYCTLAKKIIMYETNSMANIMTNIMANIMAKRVIEEQMMSEIRNYFILQCLSIMHTLLEVDCDPYEEYTKKICRRNALVVDMNELYQRMTRQFPSDRMMDLYVDNSISSIKKIIDSWPKLVHNVTCYIIYRNELDSVYGDEVRFYSLGEKGEGVCKSDYIDESVYNILEIIDWLFYYKVERTKLDELFTYINDSQGSLYINEQYVSWFQNEFLGSIHKYVVDVKEEPSSKSIEILYKQLQHLLQGDHEWVTVYKGTVCREFKMSVWDQLNKYVVDVKENPTSESIKILYNQLQTSLHS